MLPVPIGLFALGTLVLVANGCSTGSRAPGRGDLLQVETVPPEFVDLPRPHATQADGILTVSGTVIRKPAHDEPIPGHIDVLLIDADGNELEEISLTWTPGDIPTTGTRSSTYLMRYGRSLPVGATVRVGIEDDAHPMDHSGGTNVGGASGTASHPRTPGTPRQRGTPHTKGTPGMSSRSHSGGKR